MRAIKHIVVFIGTMLTLVLIFGLTGFYDFQPSIDERGFPGWFGFTLGLTIGHPLPWAIAVLVSFFLVKPKKISQQSTSSEPS